jgi:hypothetical protein
MENGWMSELRGLFFISLSLKRLWITMGCLGNALTAMAWTHALVHLADQKLPQ